MAAVRTLSKYYKNVSLGFTTANSIAIDIYSIFSTDIVSKMYMQNNNSHFKSISRLELKYFEIQKKILLGFSIIIGFFPFSFNFGLIFLTV